MLQNLLVKSICSSAWAQYVKCLENSNGVCFSTLKWKPRANIICDKNVSSVNFGYFHLDIWVWSKNHPCCTPYHANIIWYYEAHISWDDLCEIWWFWINILVFYCSPEFCDKNVSIQQKQHNSCTISGYLSLHMA